MKFATIQKAIEYLVENDLTGVIHVDAGTWNDAASRSPCELEVTE